MPNRPHSTVERPRAERPGKGPRPVVRSRRRADLLIPVRLGAALAVGVWPVRWALDATGDTLIGWTWLYWGLAWTITAAVIATHVTNTAERRAAGLALAVAGVWAHAVWWAWATAGVLTGYLGVGVILAVGAQALNHREWERGQVADECAAWPELMAGTAWADLIPVGGRREIAPGVIRRRFRRRDKATTRVKDLLEEDARTRYEERHHLDHGSVRVERDGKSSDDVLVTEVRRDPHAGRSGIQWDGTVLTHVWDELILGYYEDHLPEIVQPWRPGVGPTHMLIAGVTGSGKSTLMRLLVAVITPAREANTHMIDCKGGQSFGRMAALFSWFTRDAEAAVRHLEALVALMRDRQQQSGDHVGSGAWYPSREHPVQFVFIDELARLVGLQAPSNALQKRALAALVQLVQEGRSTGFCVIAATQYPTVDAIGSVQFRSQIDWRACFRMAEEGNSAIVLTHMPKGVEPARIDESRNGTCYVQAGSKCRAVPLRVLNITDGLDEHGQPAPDVPDQTGPLVHDWWDRVTPIPDEEQTVLDRNGAWSDRLIYGPDGQTWVEDPEPDDDTPTDPPIPGAPPCRCGTHPTAVDVLAGACPCGAPITDRAALAALALAAPTKEHTMTHTPTHPADHIPLVDLAAAHTPTPAQAAADADAAARQEPARPDDDTPAARDAAWALVLAAGWDGVAPVDIYKHPTVNRSASWGYKRFAEWREAGHMTQLTAGTHRAADHHLNP